MNKPQIDNLKSAYAQYKKNVDEIMQGQKDLLDACRNLERTQRVSDAKHKIGSLLNT